MAAQQYRTPITFQRATETLDSARQPIATYSDLVTTGARVTSVSGRLAADAGLEETGAGVTVMVRWHPTLATVTVQDRMVIRGNNYDISAVDVSFDNTYIRFVGRSMR